MGPHRYNSQFFPKFKIIEKKLQSKIHKQFFWTENKNKNYHELWMALKTSLYTMFFVKSYGIPSLLTIKTFKPEGEVTRERAT